MAYQCVMPGCPATHESKWQVCSTDESLQQQITLAHNLLRECAEVLRTDIGECADCDWGHGATVQDAQYHPCRRCTPLRELLRRVEAVT